MWVVGRELLIVAMEKRLCHLMRVVEIVAQVTEEPLEETSPNCGS